jgi:O-antigen/teichoic acid export membrane protein
MIFGPFQVVFTGVSQVSVPEGRRWMQRGPKHLIRFCTALGAGLALGTFTFGLVLLAVLPRGVGEFVLGDVWRAAYHLLPGAITSYLAGSMIVGASAGLRALGSADRSLRAQGITTALTVAVGGAGAAVAGAEGAVWGHALAVIVAAAVWWYRLVVATRGHQAQFEPKTGRSHARTDP